jgi:hypothetical protein
MRPCSVWASPNSTEETPTAMTRPIPGPRASVMRSAGHPQP